MSNEIYSNVLMINYKKTDDIFSDMQGIIETLRKAAHSAVNTLLVQRNRLIGYRILIQVHDTAAGGMVCKGSISTKLETLSSHRRIEG